MTRVFPEVDARHPLECRISGVRDPLANETKSLPSVIESMGPHAVTSIVLEYETENKKQAERFFLHKNPDVNIVWQTNELIPATQDLRELNRRLRLLILESSAQDLPPAGAALFLSDEAGFIANQLNEILKENAILPHSLDLSKPMTRSIIWLENEDEVKPWQQRRLRIVADRYQRQIDRCQVRGLPAPPNVPNEMEAGEVLAALAENSLALERFAKGVISRYDPKQRLFAQT